MSIAKKISFGVIGQNVKLEKTNNYPVHKKDRRSH